ncbi:hypothetical protein AGMMS49983_15240 [Clostridia bacterium]|nr:hypothetical protein AGMMS49983_15240 [Clostridia bacterium]
MKSGERLIFIGTKAVKQFILDTDDDGEPWVHDRFGCRVGLAKSECVLWANSADLPLKEYKEFVKYCKTTHLNHHEVIIPPDSMAWELWESTKEKFGKEQTQTVNRAQYSTLIYTFAERYLDGFINATGAEDSDDQEDLEVPPEIKDEAKRAKKAALAQLSWRQALSCHAIIHGTAIACGAVAFIPVPVADAIPITSAQAGMVVALGKVLGNKITKADATVLLKALAAPLVGRAAAKSLLVFVPGVGWGINGAVALTITEVLGWTVANDFASKARKRTIGISDNDAGEE